MKKVLVLLTAAIFMLSAANNAFARGGNDFGKHNSPQRQSEMNQGDREGFHKNRPEMSEERKQKMQQRREEIKNRLNLTEEQEAKARQLREEAKPQIKPIFEKKRALHEEIQKLKQSGASKEELKVKFDEMKALREQANKLREKHRQEFESILNAEQRAEFAQIKQEMKQKREEFKKNRKEKMQNWKNEHKFQHGNKQGNY